MAYQEINKERAPKRWVTYAVLALLAVAAFAVAFIALTR